MTNVQLSTPRLNLHSKTGWNARFRCSLAQRAQIVVNDTVMLVSSKWNSKLVSVYVCAQCAWSYSTAYSKIYVVKQAQNAHFVEHCVLRADLSEGRFCVHM